MVVVQHPTISLADDVAATRRAIAACEGDVMLVGHSYGGVVITEAGVDPKVSALVYVAAFAPDRGASVASLNAAAPPDAPKPPILGTDGWLLLDKAQFPAAFAADVASDVAEFMADSQLPWGVQALSGTVSSPAWRTKPAWYLVAQDDRMIPADAQRGMAARAGATVADGPGKPRRLRRPAPRGRDADRGGGEPGPRRAGRIVGATIPCCRIPNETYCG